MVKDNKNGVLQFLKQRRIDSSKHGLVENTLAFMNFRAGSLSGNSYHAEDARFEMLSDRLRARICEAVYLPKLKKICFFGWDEMEDDEETKVKGLFDATDTDASGFLDRDEIEALFAKLGISLTGEIFAQCYDELGAVFIEK